VLAADMLHMSTVLVDQSIQKLLDHTTSWASLQLQKDLEVSTCKQLMNTDSLTLLGKLAFG
jgi:hypothetical protein